MKIAVTAAGLCVTHSDTIVARLRAAGIRFRIHRASHVEPTDDGRWTADLSPVAGPILGPFDDRADALALETAWLAAHAAEVADYLNRLNHQKDA